MRGEGRRTFSCLACVFLDCLSLKLQLGTSYEQRIYTRNLYQKNRCGEEQIFIHGIPSSLAPLPKNWVYSPALEGRLYIS